MKSLKLCMVSCLLLLCFAPIAQAQSLKLKRQMKDWDNYDYVDASQVNNVTPRYGRMKASDGQVIGWENIELISDRPFIYLNNNYYSRYSFTLS